MKFTTALLFLSFSFAADTEPPRVIPQGLSRVETIPFPVGEVTTEGMDAVLVTKTIVDQTASSIRRVYVLANGIGKATLRVREKGGKRTVSIPFEVVPKGESREKDEFVSRELASDNQARVIDLTVGVGMTLHMPEPIGSVWVSDTSITDFVRVREGAHERKLWLTPRQEGLTDLFVNKSGSNRHQARYFLRVHPRGNIASIRRQMADESGIGLPVEWVELKKGEKQEFLMPTLDGPIFLTDTSVIDYVRVPDPEKPRLAVSPRAAGITDLTVFGPDGGQPIKRYYFEVRE